MDRSKILKVLPHANSSGGSTDDTDWKNIVANAGIMAGISLFTALVAGVEPAKAAISAGLAFFISLGIQRGLVKEAK
jgi:hypothetical protein